MKKASLQKKNLQNRATKLPQMTSYRGNGKQDLSFIIYICYDGKRKYGKERDRYIWKTAKL